MTEELINHTLKTTIKDYGSEGKHFLQRTKTVYVLGFISQRVAVATTRPWHCGMKPDTGNKPSMAVFQPNFIYTH